MKWSAPHCAHVGPEGCASCSTWPSRKRRRHRLALADEAKGVRRKWRTLEFRRMFANPMDPNNFIDIQSGGRHRGTGLGLDADAPVPALYCERKGLQDRVAGRVRPAMLRASRAVRSRSLAITRGLLFAHRNRRSSFGSQIPFDSSAADATPFASLFVYPEVDDSIEIEINPPTCASTPFAPRVPVGSTSTRPIRPSASPMRPAASSCSARTTARNIATAPSPWRCSSQIYELELRKRQSPDAAKAGRLQNRHRMRIGHQIPSYVLDQSRIKGPAHQRRNQQHRNSSMAISDEFIEASLKMGSLTMTKAEDGRIEKLRGGTEDRTLREEIEINYHDGSIIAERRENCKGKPRRAATQRRGIPNDFRPKDLAVDLHRAHGGKSAGFRRRAAHEATVGGRIMFKRLMGKAAFATVQDSSARISSIQEGRNRRGGVRGPASVTTWATSSARWDTCSAPTPMSCRSTSPRSGLHQSRSADAGKNSMASPTPSSATACAT